MRIDGLNMGMKQNYSYLFNSLSGSNSNLNWLSDYTSIKNGSYGKLMKAYYAKDNVKSTATSKVSDILDQKKKTLSTAKDNTEKIANIKKSTDTLQDSAKALTSGKVFDKDEEGKYNVDEIYKNVSSFVNSYNEAVKASADSKSTNVQSRLQSMENVTNTNKKMLGNIGITINDDNTLKIDEEKFKGSNMDTVKSMFGQNNSYANSVSARSMMIESAAENEARQANTYTQKGAYSDPYNIGTLFQSFV